MIAVLDGAGLDALQVTSGAGLGHGDGRNQLAGTEAGEPAGLLLVIGQVPEVRAGDIVMQAESDAGVASLGHLFGDDRVVAEIDKTTATELLGHIGAQEALFAGLDPQCTVDDLVLLPLLLVRLGVPIQEGLERLTEQFVLGFENSAFELNGAGHDHLPVWIYVLGRMYTNPLVGRYSPARFRRTESLESFR
ncbi:Uncharacterised protein [Mycobacteroides abscessus subsp. abscessus]|nr:Uncharacterised protein [Mycobacteroides abscessus subsp. abscessus]